jgi:hypothetical protein
MNKETIKNPKLVDPINFKKLVEPVKFKFDINIIILIIFLVFFVFFLLNCKSGIFKNIDLDPVPYSMIK